MKTVTVAWLLVGAEAVLLLLPVWDCTSYDNQNTTYYFGLEFSASNLRLSSGLTSSCWHLQYVTACPIHTWLSR